MQPKLGTIKALFLLNRTRTMRPFKPAIRPSRLYNPNLVEAWSNKGASLIALGRYSEADFCLDKALNGNPKLADAWGNKGVIQTKLEMYNAVIACFDKAINLNPQDGLVWFEKGRILLYNLANNDEALKAFDKAIELTPSNTWAWAGKAISLSNLGRTTEAEAVLAKMKKQGLKRGRSFWQVQEGGGNNG